MDKNKKIAHYITLLKSFPPYKKSKRRRAHLRIKHLGNKKVFFEVFIQKIFKEKYNPRDKIRRLECIPLLPKIFTFVKPTLNKGNYVFHYKNTEVIVKKAKDTSFNLLTIYPN